MVIVVQLRRPRLATRVRVISIHFSSTTYIHTPTAFCLATPTGNRSDALATPWSAPASKAPGVHFISDTLRTIFINVFLFVAVALSRKRGVLECPDVDARFGNAGLSVRYDMSGDDTGFTSFSLPISGLGDINQSLLDASVSVYVCITTLVIIFRVPKLHSYVPQVVYGCTKPNGPPESLPSTIIALS